MTLASNTNRSVLTTLNSETTANVNQLNPKDRRRIGEEQKK